MNFPPNIVQYWNNGPSSCFDHKCSRHAEPIIGCFTGEEDPLQIRWIADRQESALDWDHYGKHKNDIDHFDISYDRKKAIILENKNQRPGPTLSSVYPGIPILALGKGVERFQEHDDEGKIFHRQIFFPTYLPDEMNFSSVFLTNHAFQGVLHSFLRHHSDWSQFEPYVEVALDRLQVIRKLIDDISSAYYMSRVRSAINALMEEMRTMSLERFNGLSVSLFSIIY